MTELTQEKLLQKFKPIFYPKSVAVVGASRDELKVGSHWVKTIINAGFSGDIYPVNPSGGEVLGLKIYPSLVAIPGAVDYVIVSIPREAVPGLLDDCVTKKVKAVHFFTAGFSELGDTTGNKLEEEMVRKARQGGFHIIGPNCIGAYCPESKFPYGSYGPIETINNVGAVGFISQSGGIGGKLVELGATRGIKFSKGVSFGNGIDLDSVDFLEYMAVDPKTSIIGIYIEGSRNGRRLINTMRDAAKVKPLIVWKGGRTEAGAKAAKSHTGSLASPAATWSAALKQAGAVEVHSLEELTDTLLIFQQIQRWQGKGIAIVGGLANGGGGISVSASDTCAELGLNIPSLSQSTQQQLLSLLGQVGSIVHNPVDVSQSQSRLPILQGVFKAVLADSAINLLIVQEDMGILLAYITLEGMEAINDTLINLRISQSKPIVIVLPSGAAEAERLQMERKLSKASIPVFPTMERAARALRNISWYSSKL